ncbi:MAG: ATP-dependent Clp protease adaptor ClpS [Desulfuromonas sp.]|nr:MAG: ATP-dependent Clp protease adaptor ClpS [Desulfuromonas sp.]
MAQKTETHSATEAQRQTLTPPLFTVIMLNDDYTSMEFVIETLEKIFRKPPPEATRIMLNIHQQGEGVCGHYPFEIAETKVALVHERAEVAGFPLRCRIDAA